MASVVQALHLDLQATQACRDAWRERRSEVGSWTGSPSGVWRVILTGWAGVVPGVRAAGASDRPRDGDDAPCSMPSDAICSGVKTDLPGVPAAPGVAWPPAEEEMPIEASCSGLNSEFFIASLDRARGPVPPAGQWGGRGGAV